MHRTQRLTLIATIAAAALAVVTATAAAQEPYSGSQKPPAPVETGALDTTRTMSPAPGQPADTGITRRSGATTGDSAMTEPERAKKAKSKKGQHGESQDSTKPKKPE